MLVSIFSASSFPPWLWVLDHLENPLKETEFSLGKCTYRCKLWTTIQGIISGNLTMDLWAPPDPTTIAPGPSMAARLLPAQAGSGRWPGVPSKFLWRVPWPPASNIHTALHISLSKIAANQCCNASAELSSFFLSFHTIFQCHQQAKLLL